jgi:hypothetical protein
MGPVSSPKVVCPLWVAHVSFEQVLSNKLHSTLVIQPIASKKVSTALLLSKLAKPTKLLQQPSFTDASDVKSEIVTLLHTSNSVTASHDMSSNNSIIVQDMHKKKCILMAFQEKNGSKYPELIVTRENGKVSNNTSLHCARIRPSLDKWYQVGFCICITSSLPSSRSAELFLKWRPLQSLFGEQGLCKHCPKGTPLVTSWFTSLQDPCLGYEQQDHIDPYCVEMASTAMIHFGLDPGEFVRFLSGEYTGQHWDVRHTLDAVRDHITPDNYGHIKQILLDSCPTQLTFEEPSSNKLEFISCGNSKIFVENLQLDQKTMNKEDCYSHLVPMDPLFCK